MYACTNSKPQGLEEIVKHELLKTDLTQLMFVTGNLRTKILDFRGFDSSMILIGVELAGP